MCKSLRRSQFPTPVSVLWTSTRTQHLPASPLGPQNHTFSSSWVAMPMQNRSHFFPIYLFPRQVALTPVRCQALSWALHPLVWPTWHRTPVLTWAHSSLLPGYPVKCSPTDGRWMEVVHVTYRSGLLNPPSHCLPCPLPHLPAGQWPLDDLDKLGLKLVKPVAVYILEQCQPH